jgi:uncharacterized protein YdaU (DUF1376 family)
LHPVLPATIYLTVLQNGIQSLLVFIGAWIMRFDERLDKLERISASNVQEVKKVQTVLAESFSVSKDLKV